MRTKPLRDITGQRFGNLEVLKMQQDITRKDRMWYAICKCHVCGRTDYKAVPYWVKGKYGSHTKSCGCDKTYFKRQTGRNSSKFKGFEGMNSGYISNAKRRAKNKKLKFDITAKFLWQLYEKQNRKCALSGVDINFSPTNRRRSEGTISLDRIDSSKGYTKDNVQWVHKDVNNIKMEFNQDEFLELCKKICLHNNILVEKT